MYKRLEDERTKIEAAEEEPEVECNCRCLGEDPDPSDEAPPVDKAATALAVYWDVNG